MQIVLILAALAAVMMAVKPKAVCDEIPSGLLGFFWLWTGVVYHLIFFTEINPAAYIFGAAFVFQGFLFLYEGFLKKRLNFRFELNLYGILGALFIVYALIIYPLIGFAFGRIYPASPTFGAPCPMVIFTFGLLMWTDKKLAWHLLIIPVLWAFIATSAAVSFGVKEDFGLLIAGTIGKAFIIRRDFTPEKETQL
jgi:hypothetical protein